MTYLTYMCGNTGGLWKPVIDFDVIAPSQNPSLEIWKRWFEPVTTRLSKNWVGTPISPTLPT